MTRKKTKTATTEPVAEQTVEAPPELSAAQKLDQAIRSKAHDLMGNVIEETWLFLQKPDKAEFDPEVLDLLARREINEPRPTLEGDLVGLLLVALDNEMRLKVKPERASMPRTPTSLANQPPDKPRVRQQSTPTDPDLLAERLLKATTGRKK